MKLVLQVGCKSEVLWDSAVGSTHCESVKLVLLQEVLKLLRWATVFGA